MQTQTLGKDFLKEKNQAILLVESINLDLGSVP